MVQTLQSSEINLGVLIKQFNLQAVEDDRFFPEWREDLPNLTNDEMQLLDRVKAGYKNLRQSRPLLQKTVQLAVLSPMFFLANFYLPPFQMRSEESIEVAFEDKGIEIRGQLDILKVKDSFWVMAIESVSSKSFPFSVEAGFNQMLAYLLANAQGEKPLYGTIATGGSFIFIKLVQEQNPKYATSDQFCTLNEKNGLHEAFRVLKRIGNL